MEIYRLPKYVPYLSIASVGILLLYKQKKVPLKVIVVCPNQIYTRPGGELVKSVPMMLCGFVVKRKYIDIFP